jgi:hypothetical protein
MQGGVRIFCTLAQSSQGGFACQSSADYLRDCSHQKTALLQQGLAEKGMKFFLLFE